MFNACADRYSSANRSNSVRSRGHLPCAAGRWRYTRSRVADHAIDEITGPRLRFDVDLAQVLAHDPDGEHLDSAQQEDRQGHGRPAGHRSVGGFRVSMYNALTIDSVKALTDLMKDFATKKG